MTASDILTGIGCYAVFFLFLIVVIGYIKDRNLYGGTTISVTNAADFQPGDEIQVGSERLMVKRVDVSRGTLTVEPLN